MLPNTLVIGVQKGGSSWLTECLGAHPDVFMVPHEVYFFNRNYDQGVAPYEALFERHAGESVVGEGTPGYIFEPEAPARIAETLGRDVKLLASLRDPVKRAYSAFWMYTTVGDIPVGTDFVDFFHSKNKFDVRERGFYHEQLARYYATFDRDDILVLVQEEDLKNGPETTRRCYEHVGVDASFVPERASTRVNANRNFKVGHRALMDFGKFVARNTVSWAPEPMLRVMRKTYRGVFDRLPEKQEYAALDPEIHATLMAEYIDDLRRLEDLIGRDLSVWYGDTGL